MQVAGKGRGIAPDVDRTGDLALDLGDRLAGLDRIEIGDLIEPHFDEGRCLQQDARTLRRRHAGPGAIVKGPAGGENGAFRVRGIGLLVATDDHTVSGRHALQRATFGAADPLTVDQHGEFANRRLFDLPGGDEDRHYHSPLK